LVRAKEFNRLVKSIREAGEIRRGRLRLGRAFEFALMIGVSTATLQNWEQGRRRPEGPARALLKVAAADPVAVERALGA
jgi:putative transcriptional regulator